MANRITNPWLNTLQRSYSQIKSKLISAITNLRDRDGKQLITDVSEGNILVLLVSLFSAIAEVLHYYIDNASREAFLSTARRYESLVKHAKLVDYHPRAAIAATVDLVISRPVTSSNLSQSVNIPKNTRILDSHGNVWLTSKDINWPSNTTSVKVPLVQHEPYTISELVGAVLPSDPRSRMAIVLPSFSNDSRYEHNTMSLTLDNEEWTLVDTFAHSTLSDKHFIVQSENGVATIIFGDGSFGKKPSPSSKVTSATCYVTTGSQGNIAAGELTDVPTVVITNVSDATANNPYPAGGGSDYETFDMMKEHIPLSVKHLGVAITKQDFIDLAKTVDGVNKVAMEYECGRKLNIYISPDNGTVASSALLTRVYEVLKQHSPLTTWLNVKSVGIVNIILEMDVTGKKSVASSDIQTQIVSALMDAYSIEKAEIGGKVRISDIYALIDNLPGVDYLHITKFYLKPWPSTINGSAALNIGNYVLNSYKGRASYLVVFSSATNFRLYAIEGGYTISGEVGQPINVKDDINGIDFSMTILDAGYQANFKYTFTVSSPEFDYDEPGFNLPLFTSPNQLTLKINEVL